jgi:rRNA maturation protein Nop10
MLSKIICFFNGHYYPGSPELIFENRLVQKYKIECVKCGNQEFSVIPTPYNPYDEFMKMAMTQAGYMDYCKQKDRGEKQ